MKPAHIEGIDGDHDSGRYRKAMTSHVAIRRPMRTQRDSVIGRAHHSESNAPRRRAMSRYTSMITIGTIE